MSGTSTGRSSAVPFALSIVAFGLAPAQAQQEAWRVSGVVRNESLGHSIAIVSDHDGDGVRDLLVGAPGYDGDTPTGRALLLSGSDLATLLEIAGPLGEYTGDAVADAGDVDGDGVGDLLVGSSPAGVARLHSGATGAELLKLTAVSANEHLGAALVGLGDVDGDGVPDFAVGAPDENRNATSSGVVHVVSGATGATVRSFQGSHATAHVGKANFLANAGDVDGDGVADLALLDVEQAASQPFGVVRVKSGATGVELVTAKFDQVGYRAFHLSSVANVGDLDGDAIDDLAVGGLPNNPALNPGRVFLLSGADGSSIRRIDTTNSPQWLVVGPAGDVDGDLVPDLVASTTDPTSGTKVPTLFLLRGSDGATIGTITGTPWSLFGSAFAAGIDSDGDGQEDVAIGEPSAKRDNIPSGELRLARWPGGGLITRIAGLAEDRRFRGDVAMIDDFDGDGANDFVATDPDTPSILGDALRVHSGRDGSLLVEHSVAARPDGALVAVPDQDGDGRDDVAFGNETFGANPTVDVVSTATGVRLRRITGKSGSAFGIALAVGVQPGGAIQLAIGAPNWLTANGSGEVQVYDLGTGALVFAHSATAMSSDLGQSVAWMGDVDGDGVGDWAFGSPFRNNLPLNPGHVDLVSGGGLLITSIPGVVNRENFGFSVVALGDVDGDGRSDLAASAINSGAVANGEVRLYGSIGWTLLGSLAGPQQQDYFGTRLETLPDLNGDGVDEWLARGAKPPRWELRSGATMGPLAFLPTPTRYDQSIATPREWQVGSANGDRIPDVLITDSDADAPRSQAWLVAMDDLLLQIDPAVASAGDTVTHAVRGGPVGGPVALEFVAFSGVPVRSLIEMALFDGAGTWSTSDVVPPGLAGLDADFRGWAIGFNGRLMQSPVQRLTFE